MVYDIVFLLVILLFAVIGYFRKASKTLIGLFVLILSSLGSYYLSDLLSPLIYDSMIYPWICDTVSERISDAATAGTENIGEAILTSVPAFLLSLLELFGLSMDFFSQAVDEFIASGSEKIAVMCAEFMRSPFVSVISFLLGITLFIMLMIILSWLSKYVLKLCTFLLSETLDSVLGSVFGVLKGVLVVVLMGFILTMVLPLVTTDLWILSPEYYENSIVLSMFFSLNL